MPEFPEELEQMEDISELAVADIFHNLEIDMDEVAYECGIPVTPIQCFEHFLLDRVFEGMATLTNQNIEQNPSTDPDCERDESNGRHSVAEGNH